MQITVIIATTCESVRRESLQHAIDCILRQQGGGCRPLVVINGQRFEPGLRRELEQRSDLDCVYLEPGSLPNAIHEGVKRVRTPFFAFLDDDDLLSEDAMAIRLAAMAPADDVVVTDGWIYNREQPCHRLFDQPLEVLAADPLTALMRRNWLASCGGLYRRERVDASFFDPEQRYFEWTFTAFRLAQSRRIRFIDTPTWHYCYSECSLSQSESSLLAEPMFLSCLEDLARSAPLVEQLKRKKISSLHHLAGYYLAHRRFGRSWAYHLQSLLSPYGLKYLLFSRHIIYGWLKTIRESV